jgi:hypothetical protein
MRRSANRCLGQPGIENHPGTPEWDLLSQLAGSRLTSRRTHRMADRLYDLDNLGSSQNVWGPADCDCSHKSKM